METYFSIISSSPNDSSSLDSFFSSELSSSTTHYPKHNQETFVWKLTFLTTSSSSDDSSSLDSSSLSSSELSSSDSSLSTAAAFCSSSSSSSSLEAFSLSDNSSNSLSAERKIRACFIQSTQITRNFKSKIEIGNLPYRQKFRRWKISSAKSIRRQKLSSPVKYFVTFYRRILFAGEIFQRLGFERTLDFQRN